MNALPVILCFSLVCLIPIGWQLFRLSCIAARRRTFAKGTAAAGLVPDQPAGKGVPLRASGKRNGFTVVVTEHSDDHIVEGGTTLRQTETLISHPDFNFPRFTIEPRSVALVVRQTVEVKKGMMFPKAERFSRMNFVNSYHEDATRDCITPKLCTLLRENKILTVEAEGQNLRIYRAGETLSAKAIPDLLDRALAVAAALRPTDTP